MASNPSTSISSAPEITGLNHIKLPVFNLSRTLDFYTKIFPFTFVSKWNHYTPEHKLFAQMFTLPPSSSTSDRETIVEIRYHPQQAEAQKGWDPITWGVSTRASLEEWGKWLDLNGVKRSQVFVGIKGWVMGVEDPDGKIVRLYVEDEEHEWIDHPDQDEYWLGYVHADPEV